jgi:glutamyl/glutaminyl-tRNA synthetase
MSTTSGVRDISETICNFLALNGWSPGHDIEKFDNAFLKERFSLDRVIKTPAKFDRVKLLAFNTDRSTRCHAKISCAAVASTRRSSARISSKTWKRAL